MTYSTSKRQNTWADMEIITPFKHWVIFNIYFKVLHVFIVIFSKRSTHLQYLAMYVIPIRGQQPWCWQPRAWFTMPISMSKTTTQPMIFVKQIPTKPWPITGYVISFACAFLSVLVDNQTFKNNDGTHSVSWSMYSLLHWWYECLCLTVLFRVCRHPWQTRPANGTSPWLPASRIETPSQTPSRKKARPPGGWVNRTVPPPLGLVTPPRAEWEVSIFTFVFFTNGEKKCYCPRSVSPLM